MSKNTIEARLMAKPRSTTWALELKFPTGNPPTVLLADLAKIGWMPDPLPGVPPLNDINEQDIVGPRGTGLFGSWTKAEERTHTNAVLGVMAKHEIPCPKERLKWGDCL